MSALMELVENFRDLSLFSELTPIGVKVENVEADEYCLKEIKEGQKSDVYLVLRMTLVIQGKGEDFKLDEFIVFGVP